MGVRVTNLTATRISLPDPLTYILKAREVKTFEYVEYDLVINVPEIDRLQRLNYILISSLDPAVGGYDSAWNGPRRFYLGGYQLWVDGTGALRMKNGTAVGDLDGFVVGPGGTGLHGATHVFNGPDPIPNIETLEDLWIMLPGTVALYDVVFEVGANVCAKANASSIVAMPVIGVVVSIPSPARCVVARSGEVINPGWALIPDQAYFAGLIAGTLTASPPGASTQVVQKVGYAKNSTTLMVEIEPFTVRA